MRDPAAGRRPLKRARTIKIGWRRIGPNQLGPIVRALADVATDVARSYVDRGVPGPHVNRHATKRLRRALEIVAPIACDALAEGNRAGAIGVLATAVPLENAIAWTMPYYPPVYDAVQRPINGNHVSIGPYSADDAALTSALAKASYGYASQYQQRPMPLAPPSDALDAVGLGTALHLALERAANLSGTSIDEVTSAFRSLAVGRDIAA